MDFDIVVKLDRTMKRVNGNDVPRTGCGRESDSVIIRPVRVESRLYQAATTDVGVDSILNCVL